MNNRERAQQIADEHGNDAYSVALAMLEEQNKIKAEAVSEVAEMSFIDDAFTYQMIKAHAKKNWGAKND